MVIAIIAILAAILFPVFAKAREKARQSSCSSNVKQITLGLLQYASDYDQTFPRTDCASGLVGRDWFQVVSPYIKNDQIFKCPSDSGAITTLATTYCTGPNSFYNPVALSYGYNISRNNDTTTDTVVSNTTAGVAATFMMGDGGAPWMTPDPASAYSTYAATSGYARTRHNDGLNTSYYDGHVKWVSGSNWNTLAF